VDNDDHRLNASNAGMQGGRSSSVPTAKQSKSRTKGKKDLLKNQTTANINKVETEDKQKKADDGAE